uniref:Epimerase domain-containing protein n=1 Tax=Steinernema glaseri TaxID=37863 RepID=A0A1I7YX10_9BILA
MGNTVPFLLKEHCLSTQGLRSFEKVGEWFGIKDSTMRMCLLGGGGYFGQNLTMQLQKEGHSVVVLDLSFPKFEGMELDPLKLKMIKGSILDSRSLDEALEDCDACFHLAGYGMARSWTPVPWMKLSKTVTPVSTSPATVCQAVLR